MTTHATIERLEPRTLLSAIAAVDFSVTQDWGTGFEAGMKLTNLSSPVSSWTLEFDFPFNISSIWEGHIASHTGSHYAIANQSYNGSLGTNASVLMGFVAAPGNVGTTRPTNYLFNGVPIDGGVGLPHVSATGASASETDGPGASVNFVVALSQASTQSVNVSYATADGSAHAGSDYAAKSGTLSFDPGQTSKTISVDLIGDTTAEPTESFSVNFSGAQNAVLDTPTATGTIVDNDSPQPPPGSNQRIIGYYPEWGTYTRNYQVASIPADKLTHIYYAFAKISDAGEVAIFDTYAAIEKSFPGDTWDQPIKGNFHQLQLLKQGHPNLRTMISVGGWTLSGKFSDVALTAASRDKFSASAVAFIRQYGFDGVDLDWEYPVEGGLAGNVTRPEDKTNFTLLLQSLRSHLDAAGAADGKHYELAAALSAGFQHIDDLELAPIGAVLDNIDVMTYDYHGTWENATNHLAPLYATPGTPGSFNGRFSIDYTLNAYLAAGIDPRKISIGLPMYTVGWSGVPNVNNGLFQSSTGIPPGTYSDGPGNFNYADMYNRVKTQPNIYHQYWDDTAKAPYVYAPTANGLFSTFEDSTSIRNKMLWAKDHGLGGAFAWELSSDIRDSDNHDSILWQMNHAMTDLAAPTVSSAQFIDTPLPAMVVYSFSEDVSPSLSLNSVRVTSVGSGQTIAPSAWSYDALTRTARFTLPKSLAEGQYTATVSGDTIYDLAANRLDGDGNGIAGGTHTLNFTVGTPLPNGTWTGAGDGASWSDANNWANDQLPTSLDDVVIDSPGTFTVNLSSAFTRVKSLAIGGTGSAPTVALTAGGNHLFETGALTIYGNAKLDLNDNDLIADSSGASSLAEVQAWINSARHGGDWLGTTGITSSAARNNPNHNTTLGAMEAADYTLVHGGPFDGQTVSSTAVLVKYTYYGDANFSGAVDFDDYVRIDLGFNLARSGWVNGDFNGSGVVDFDDYVLIDIAFNTQGASLKRPGLRGPGIRRG